MSVLQWSLVNKISKMKPACEVNQFFWVSRVPFGKLPLFFSTMWASNAQHALDSSELLQGSCPFWIKLKILLMDNLDFRPGARIMLLLGQDIGTFSSLIYVCTTVTWAKLKYPPRNLAWIPLCVGLICTLQGISVYYSCFHTRLNGISDMIERSSIFIIQNNHAPATWMELSGW